MKTTAILLSLLLLIVSFQNRGGEFLSQKSAIGGENNQLAASRSQGQRSASNTSNYVAYLGSASPETIDQAKELARMLQRMTGLSYVAEPGNGSTGILVATAEELGSHPLSEHFRGIHTFNKGRFLIRNHKEGLYIIGARKAALQNAIWDYLHRLGYRQYFPGKKWEIVPKISTTNIDVDVIDEPDYISRRIWYGYGPWDYAKEPYFDWLKKNRLTSSFSLNTGHAYTNIINKYSSTFKAHPEYYAAINGERPTTGANLKFDVSNPNLRKLVVDYALAYFKTNPDQDSISMDPSDGGGWCNSLDCLKIGSPSDQAVFLANEVARAINADSYKQRYVGIYAYNYHSIAPSIEVHPNVIVTVATAFIKGGYTLDEIISSWKAKNVKLGIREYYSVFPWDKDLPGKPLGSNLQYLKTSIPSFKSKQAIAITAESSDNWGSTGFGYYAAARLMWDTNEAANLQNLKEEFVEDCFKEAAAPMQNFYDILLGQSAEELEENNINALFSTLLVAKDLVTTAEVSSRLNDLTLYLHYVDLFHRYQAASGNQRQRHFENLVKYTYRMRKTMMVHAKALYRDQVRRDGSVSIPSGAAWDVPEADNPWKSSEPFSSGDYARFLEEGISNFSRVTMDFTPRHFSNNLVPMSKRYYSSDTTNDSVVSKMGRRLQKLYTWVEIPYSKIHLEVAGGLSYGDRGNVKIKLVQLVPGDQFNNDAFVVAEDTSVIPDKKFHPVELQAKEAGLYRIEFNDGNDSTKIRWTLRNPMTIKSSSDDTENISSRFTGYFYVPKGTTKVGFYGGGTGKIFNALGDQVFDLEGIKPGYYSIPVETGQDGSHWKVHGTLGGTIKLLNVPPYLSKRRESLLIPRGVDGY